MQRPGRMLARNRQHPHVGPDAHASTGGPSIHALPSAQASTASLRETLDLRSSLSPCAQSASPSKDELAAQARPQAPSHSGMASPVSLDSGPYTVASRGRASAAPAPPCSTALESAGLPPPREPSISLGGYARACAAQHGDTVAMRPLSAQGPPARTSPGESVEWAQTQRTNGEARVSDSAACARQTELQSRCGRTASQPLPVGRTAPSRASTDGHRATPEQAQLDGASARLCPDEQHVGTSCLGTSSRTGLSQLPQSAKNGQGSYARRLDSGARWARARAVGSPGQSQASRSSSPDPPGSAWLGPGKGSPVLRRPHSSSPDGRPQGAHVSPPLTSKSACDERALGRGTLSQHHRMWRHSRIKRCCLYFTAICLVHQEGTLRVSRDGVSACSDSCTMCLPVSIGVLPVL